VGTFSKTFNQFLIKKFAPNTFLMESAYTATAFNAIPHTLDF